MIRTRILRATCPRCGYIKEVDTDTNWASAFVRGTDNPKCPACGYPDPQHVYSNVHSKSKKLSPPENGVAT